MAADKLKRIREDKFLQLIISHTNVAKFIFTGSINTIIDLILYAIFANLAGLNPIIASILSTGITLVVSYFLNKRFVFRSGKRHRDTALTFILITLFNVWIVQSFIIHAALQVTGIVPFFANHNWTENMFAKLCGVSVSMVLNYTGYKRIFKEES